MSDRLPPHTRRRARSRSRRRARTARPWRGGRRTRRSPRRWAVAGPGTPSKLRWSSNARARARTSAASRRARGRSPPIARHRALQSQSRDREGGPFTHGQRQPEGIGLDAAAGEPRRPDRHTHHLARHGHERGRTREPASRRASRAPGTDGRRSSSSSRRADRTAAGRRAAPRPRAAGRRAPAAATPRQARRYRRRSPPRRGPRAACRQYPLRRLPKVGLAAWRNQKLSLCLCSSSAASARRRSWAPSRPRPSQLRVSQPAVAEQIRKLETHARCGPLRPRRSRRRPDRRRPGVRRARDPTLRSLEDAADSVEADRSLHDGVASLGTFNAPSAWRFDELVSSFLERHPAMTVRLVGRNSAWTADRVRRGELEAAIVVLPIDGRQARRTPARPRRGALRQRRSGPDAQGPVTIERLASAPLVFYDAESADNDPIRRQLADRAQADG